MFKSPTTSLYWNRDLLLLFPFVKYAQNIHPYLLYDSGYHMISLKLDNIHFDPLQDELQERFEQLFHSIVSSSTFPTAKDIV
ncbi:hypothetical protein MFLAVUS_004868 [Mucor flavus]|uniref:Uncharacterized protein n=1 Tax=Mucor flavus TaxID=439312 RepID=A0ABP9YX50_9FUNG